MRLEFDSGSARCSGCVNIGVRHAEAAVMRLGNFGNYGAGRARMRLGKPGIGNLTVHLQVASA
jgi:hypothetical protein